MTIAERGTKCQSFQKGFSRFWLKICGICEPTNEREKSLACLCFSEQGGGRQSQICVKFKTKEYEKGNLEIYYSDNHCDSDGYCNHLWCHQLHRPLNNKACFRAGFLFAIELKVYTSYIIHLTSFGYASAFIFIIFLNNRDDSRRLWFFSPKGGVFPR